MAVNKTGLNPRVLLLSTLCTLTLISGNLVGEKQLTLLYFHVSFGTVLFQLVCCTLIAVAEIMPLKKCFQLIWISALLNLSFAVLYFCVLQNPIPNFWFEQSDNLDMQKQIEVVLAFSTFYIISAMGLIYAAKFVRHWLGRPWLWLRIIIVLATAMFIDMVLVSAILVWFGKDPYLSTWKILSIFSVKISLSLLSLPICYLLISYFKAPYFSYAATPR